MTDRQKNLISACVNALNTVYHQGNFDDSDFFISESLLNDLDGIEDGETSGSLLIRLKELVMYIEDK